MISDFDTMTLTLLLPIVGAIFVGAFGSRIGKTGAAGLASSTVGLSFLIVCSNIWAIHGEQVASSRTVTLWNWMVIPSGSGVESVKVGFGMLVDPLSLTLMSVITGVGFLIHWFSSEYMENDVDFTRFFSLLNIFIAAMTLLVLADNFATLIIGWGAVGFASFALIGFWREKPSAAAASKKAFVMNVIGDVGLMLAVFILYLKLGALEFSAVFEAVAKVGDNGRDWIPFVIVGLLIGAYAKSAQLPLHTWLPDAMEGPTPVSALIHAATMVTAGVYLLVRCSPILETQAHMMSFIALAGAVTALFAACCALVQNDLKRVLAYSTMSQLGYMFLAVGVGAYGAAIFHLVTHAFFKALLFLSAGIVIHAAHGEQDMRKLGGLGKQIPATAWMFGIGGCALAGVPLTSGYFSKEAILHAAHHQEGGMLVFIIGAVVAVMTAFYTGRAFFLTFAGEAKTEHPHLPGAPTTLACAVLTILALLAGWVTDLLSNFLVLIGKNGSGMAIESGANTVPAYVLSAFVLIAIFASYGMFGKGKAGSLSSESTWMSLIRGGFGFDNIYGQLAKSIQTSGQLCAGAVERLFQSSVPSAFGRTLHGASDLLRQTQTGQVRHYLVMVALSVVTLLLYILFISGGYIQ